MKDRGIVIQNFIILKRTILEVPDALIQYELPSSVRVVAEGLAG
jgi:hypothetical protein